MQFMLSIYGVGSKQGSIYVHACMMLQAIFWTNWHEKVPMALNKEEFDKQSLVAKKGRNYRTIIYERSFPRCIAPGISQVLPSLIFPNKPPTESTLCRKIIWLASFQISCTSVHALLQKVHRRRFQTPLHQWFWPSLVIAWIVTAGCNAGGGIVHHHRISVQYGGAIGYLHRGVRARSGGNWSCTTASFADDPALMTDTTTSVGRTIRRRWTRHQRRSGLWSGGVDGGINVGLVYYVAVKSCPLPPYLRLIWRCCYCPSPLLWHFFGGVVTIITASCFHITNDLDRPALILNFFRIQL